MYGLNKYTTLVAAILLFATTGRGQSLQPSVLGTLGGYSAPGGNASLTYNMGEAFTATLQNGGSILTQGFEQPDRVGLPRITGLINMCVGYSNTLSNAATGGTWSSSNARASVGSSSGVVTGISNGSSVITYTKGGAKIVTTVFVGNPPPITGPASVCIGQSVSLSDAIAGGRWQRNSIHTVIDSITGVATGNIPGQGLISYVLGPGCVASYVLTVNALSPITGASTLCNGQTVTLAATSAGGIWSSSATTVATIGSSSRIVTGMGAGAATISYMMPTGCLSTTTVTVNPFSAITGSATVGVGNTTTLSNATVGGTWAVGSIHAAVGSATGIVTGSIPGIPVITYTTGLGCRTTYTMTVFPSITGPSAVCQGLTITLANATGGGVWSSGTTAVATIGSSNGIVAGVGGGTSVISYVLPSGVTATRTVTVNVTSPITGPTSVCTGQSVTMSNAVGGGAWSVSNANASIGSGTGIVSGSAAGSSTITYTLPGGCVSTTGMIVNTLGGIGGGSVVCSGRNITLTNPAPGGTWSAGSSAASVGTTSGIVTGISAGTSVITYRLATGCAAMTTVTVNASAPITGPASICTGQSVTMNDSVSGGTWSRSSIHIGIGSTTGIVTGSIAGSTTITYSLPNGCINTAGMVVNALAGISGGTAVCAGWNITLTNSTSGGTWSAGSSAASVGITSGIVTGLAAGTSVITYRLPTGCAAMTTVTVNASAPITGPGYVCTGQTVTMNDSVSGGTWSKSSIHVGIGSTTGIVSGSIAGSTTISYTLPNGCISTTSMAVNTLSGISGGPEVCAGANITLTNAVPGGTWSTGSSSVTVGTLSGIVTGLAAGTSVITYRMPSGCAAMTTVTVNASAPITGPGYVCTGQTVTMNDSVSGGTWSKSSIHVGIGSTTGVVYGSIAGVTTISYSLPNGCATTMAMTVNAFSPITGATTVCAGQGITLADATGGGAWSTSSSTVTVGTLSGIVTGVAGGTSVITYTMPTGCTALTTVSVNAFSPIIGPHIVCIGQSITMSDATAGGTWSRSSIHVVIGSGTGIVTASIPGNTVITYAVPYASGTCSANYTMTVVALPGAGTITGPGTVVVGGTITLTDGVSGGTWSSGNTVVATVGSTGIVAGIAGGTTVIYYGVTNVNGCTSYAIKEIRVDTAAHKGTNPINTQSIPGTQDFRLRVMPNPNNGEFMLTGNTGTETNEVFSMVLVDMEGRSIYNQTANSISGSINEHVSIKNLAPGIYVLRVVLPGRMEQFPISIR